MTDLEPHVREAHALIARYEKALADSLARERELIGMVEDLSRMMEARRPEPKRGPLGLVK